MLSFLHFPSLLHLSQKRQVRDPATSTTYIVAKARLEGLPGAVPKKKAGGGGKKKGGGDAAAADGAAEAAAAAPAGFETLATFKGSELVSNKL